MVFALFLPRESEFKHIGIAREYKIDDAEYMENREISIVGTVVNKGLSLVRYSGEVSIANVFESNTGRVLIDFSDLHDIRIGSVVLEENGYLKTTPLYSVVAEQKKGYIIIVLYTEFQETKDTLTGRFDPSKMTFLCIGEIEKDEAVKLLNQIYPYSFQMANE